MLQNIRDNSKGTIAYILIGILVVFFAISGAEALFNWNANADKVAEVNGQKISKLELERAVQNQKNQILNRYGNQVPEEFISDEYLRKPVLENLIRRQLLVQAAKDSGLAVSQEELMKEITAEPGFKNEQGLFDNQKYQQMLSMMGFSHTTYLQALSEDQMLNQLRSAMTLSAFALSYEIDNAIALGFQSRDIAFFQIPVSQIRDSMALTDEEINAEYTANPASYTADEQVAVDYIELRSSDLLNNIQITEEQLRQQYEQSLATFTPAIERQAAHILIEGDKSDRITEVAAKIAAGEDFSTLAKNYSDDAANKDQGGDLGYSDGSIFPKEFEAALAALKVGQVSAAVKTEAGTHFIKLLSERGGKAPSFEEQRASLEDQLKRAEAENQFIVQLEKLKEETYNAEKLSDVAPGLGLTVKNTGFFTRNNGKEIAANPKFIEVAFSEDVLQEGNASDPIELEPSHVVVVKKTEHSPSHLKSLAEVQEQIVAKLKDKKAREHVAQKAQDYIKQLESGRPINEIAQAAGYPVKEVKAATRGSADVDMEILRHAFSMAKPVAEKISSSGLSLTNGDYAVVTVSAVSLGDKTKMPAEQQSAIVAQLSNMVGQQSFESYQKALEETAKIERN